MLVCWYKVYSYTKYTHTSIS